MGFLAGKKILITGVISNRSIAYGIAKACHREGAELAFTYQNEKVRDRVEKLASDFGTNHPLLVCDAGSDEEINAVFADLGKQWGALDGLVHAIAFSPKDALAGNFLDNVTRENFRIAHDISSYSFAAMAKAALPLMEGRAASILTLSYLGAVRYVPHYNVMGLAKASLEANVRFLAADLGPQGIRANAISAGPIKTLAAAGIPGFRKMLHHVEKTAPLKRSVTIEDVGNAAAFLCSDLAAGITGEVLYVDAGYSHVGMSFEE